MYIIYITINIQCTVVSSPQTPYGSRPIAPHQSRTGTEGRGVLFGRHHSHQGPARAAALVDEPRRYDVGWQGGSIAIQLGNYGNYGNYGKWP